MTIKKSYNIHNVISFEIIKENDFLDNIFSNIEIEYKNFESVKQENLDFTIRIGNFKPSNQDCYILDDRYYIKDDYFYCEDSYKLAKWKIEMSGFERGNMIINVSNNLIGSMFISPLIDFLISFKMNEKGLSLIHGSCVSKNNRAHIFSARSGGGKTVIALYFVENGYKFLGDNFIILNERNVLSFLSPLNIFTYNLSPIIKNNLGLKHLTTLYLKYLLYKMTFKYAKIFTKINVKNIFKNSIIDKSNLDTILLIMPKEELHKEKIDKETLIEHLVMNQKLESLAFSKYMMEYSYIYPDSSMANHWIRYKENLQKNLNGTPIYRLEVPQRYDPRMFENIFKIIGDND